MFSSKTIGRTVVAGQGRAVSSREQGEAKKMLDLCRRSAVGEGSDASVFNADTNPVEELGTWQADT